MTDDIVERLRTGEPCLEANGRPCRSMDSQSGCVCAEAADAVGRLRTALAAAEAKLIEMKAEWLEMDKASKKTNDDYIGSLEARLAKAREALTPQFIRKLETYLSIYTGDKELRRMIATLKEIT